MVHHFIVTYKDYIALVIVSAIAGFLAQMILPGRGFGMLTTFLLGLIGGVLTHYFLGKNMMFASHWFLRDLAGATIGALVLGFVWNLIRQGRDPDKTGYRNH